MIYSFNVVGLVAIAFSFCLSASAASLIHDPGAVQNRERCGRGETSIAHHDTELRVCGIINQSLVDEISSIDTPIETLYIESRGGGGPSAYQLAMIVNEREIEVRFMGLCASACVQFYLWSERVSIEADTLFVDHSSVYGRVFMVLNSNEWRDRLSENYDAETIVQARDFLQAISMGHWHNTHDYMLETTAAIGPLCAGGLVENRLIMSQQGRLLFRSEYDFWIPTQESLIRWRLGLTTDDSLSTYDETIRHRLTANQAILQDRRLRPILTDDQVLIAGEWMRSKSSFDLCDMQDDS